MPASITRAMNVAITGLQKNDLDLSITAQNLSAQGVNGYKKMESASETLAAQNVGVYGETVGGGAAVVPIGMQIGSGVRISGTYHIFSQGDMKNTENPLDVAIQGDGMFQVTMPDGTIAYTRAGAFQLNGQSGTIVTQQGYTVAPGIQVPPTATSVAISSSGVVMATFAGQTQPQTLGQIQLATFINPAGLQDLGENLFSQTASSGAPSIGNPGTNNIGTLLNGFREMSNIDPMEEITSLIKIHRWYEQLTKVLNTADSMLEASTRVGR